MKRILPFLIILLLLLTIWVAEGLGAPTQGASQARDNAIEKLKTALALKIGEAGRGRVIVELESAEEPDARRVGKKVRTRLGRELRRAAIKRLQGRLERALGRDADVRFTNIPYAALEVNELELQRLTELPEVMRIREDKLFQLVLDVSVPQIGGDLAWSEGYTGEGQVIAILDGGFDSSHGALAGKVLNEACFSTNNELEGAVSLCPSGAEEEVGAGEALNCNDILGGDQPAPGRRELKVHRSTSLVHWFKTSSAAQ